MDNRFETFTVLVSRISRNIRKLKNQEMSDYNLRSAHISCLYYLYASRGLTATDLCERCDEDKATISRALEYLEANGYLEPEAERRYRSPLVLTEMGEETGRIIAEKINGFLEQISGGLTEAERLAFYRSLAIISDSLDAMVNKDS